uniref:Uncharacterized protein n=1 Tax=Oryza rufipogon TaxID=4529 RepID=A0A0E0P1W3_ORYRU
MVDQKNISRRKNTRLKHSSQSTYWWYGKYVVVAAISARASPAALSAARIVFSAINRSNRTQQHHAGLDETPYPSIWP